MLLDVSGPLIVRVVSLDGNLVTVLNMCRWMDF